MFKNEEDTSIYLYDLYENRYVKKFNTLDDALEYNCTLLPFCNPRYKVSDSDINMNGNDTYNATDWYADSQFFYTRRYMYIDAYNRIIDIRPYKKEYEKKYEKNLGTNNSNVDWETLHYGDKLYKNSWRKFPKMIYRFRMDAVPGTSFGRGDYWRHVKTFSEIRQNSDVEYCKYVRGRRKHLPTVYDDIYRHLERSWKRQSKKRKQWM